MVSGFRPFCEITASTILAEWQTQCPSPKAQTQSSGDFNIVSLESTDSGFGRIKNSNNLILTQTIQYRYYSFHFSKAY